MPTLGGLWTCFCTWTLPSRACLEQCSASTPGSSPTHPPSLPPALHTAGEAERGAALQVAEARCAAVAGLLDEVQELQGQAEEVRGRWEGQWHAGHTFHWPSKLLH